MISLLHLQEWREVGTGGLFVGQLGCKVIRGKAVKACRTVSAGNGNAPGRGVDTWTLIRRVQVKAVEIITMRHGGDQNRECNSRFEY